MRWVEYRLYSEKLEVIGLEARLRVGIGPGDVIAVAADARVESVFIYPVSEPLLATFEIGWPDTGWTIGVGIVVVPGVVDTDDGTGRGGALTEPCPRSLLFHSKALFGPKSAEVVGVDVNCEDDREDDEKGGKEEGVDASGEEITCGRRSVSAAEAVAIR